MAALGTLTPSARLLPPLIPVVTKRYSAPPFSLPPVLLELPLYVFFAPLAFLKPSLAFRLALLFLMAGIAEHQDAVDRVALAAGYGHVPPIDPQKSSAT